MTMLEAALTRGIFTDEAPLGFLYDLDRFEAALAEVVANFPPRTLHALAIKANPVGPILRRAVELGAGLEAASAGELALALRIAPPERILLDSPAKTRPELRTAIAAGVHVNLDNLQEVVRVAELAPKPRQGQVIGLRINPVVGAGTDLSTSTAIAGSKFGVDLTENREAILRAFHEHAWLTGLHVHVGSAGMSIDHLVRGAEALADLAAEIEANGKRIALMDLGGGLSIEPAPIPVARYVTALHQGAPAVLSGRWRLATEFGRRVFGPAGLLVSQVEYTKRSGGRNIAIVHAGGDLLVRSVFVPDYPPLRIAVHRADGTRKDGATEPWDVAGPLCFSGDLIARGQALPPLEPGDLLVIENMGAYTFSHSTRYNSRPLPPIWGWRESEGLRLLRAGQSLEDITDFWDR